MGEGGGEEINFLPLCIYYSKSASSYVYFGHTHTWCHASVLVDDYGRTVKAIVFRFLNS